MISICFSVKEGSKEGKDGEEKEGEGESDGDQEMVPIYIKRFLPLMDTGVFTLASHKPSGNQQTYIPTS